MIKKYKRGQQISALVIAVLAVIITIQSERAAESNSCAEADKGKALIEIYDYSCDAKQLEMLAKNSVDDTYFYCALQGNIKKRKVPC